MDHRISHLINNMDYRISDLINNMDRRNSYVGIAI